MNWKEDYKKIKETYPKAYNAAIPYITEEDPCGWPMHGNPKILRNLYDFFDEQEILIVVFCYFEQPDMKINGLRCSYEISHHDNFDIIYEEGDKYYTSRTKTEEAAFTRAFEILEEKLK